MFRVRCSRAAPRGRNFLTTSEVRPRPQAGAASKDGHPSSRPDLNAAPTSPRRTSRAGRRADDAVRPCADRADRLAVLPRLVDPDRLRHRALRRPPELPRHLRTDLGRPRLQARPSQHRASIRRCRSRSSCRSRSLLGLLVHQTRVWGGECAAHDPLLDLHGAVDRRRAGLVQALFADRGAVQPDPRLGRHRAAAAGSPRPIPRSSRWSTSMSGSRSAISPFSSSPGSRRFRGSIYEAAKVDGATPWQIFWRITLPLLRRPLLFSAVICLINAVQVFEPVVLITPGRAGRLDQRAHLPYPPRRHRARPGRPRLGDGGDASPDPRRHGGGAVRARPAGSTTDERRRGPCRRRWRARDSAAVNWPRPLGSALVLLMIVVAVLAAFPLAWMVLSSLKTPAETMQTPPVWFPAAAFPRRLCQGLRRHQRRPLLPQLGDHRDAHHRRHHRHQPDGRLTPSPSTVSAGAVWSSA